MLGVLGKTSLVLLLCVCITFSEAGSCVSTPPVANCGSCSGPGNVCQGCPSGFYTYYKTDSDEVYKCTQKSTRCFPGSSMVSMSTGNVAMETLNIGDSVLTEIGNNQLSFTKVVGFAQREPATEGHFLSITAVNQAGHTHTVKLTATHNIYLKSKIADDHADYMPRFAADVMIGDMLKTKTDNGTALNEATVTHVTLHKEMGAYAPLTETGTMLVDGTLVSCYTSFNDFGVHILMAPIRWFPWLFADQEKPLEGKLPYVEALKHIVGSYVVPFVSLK